MTQQPEAPGETIDFEILGTSQTIVDILQDQYGTLDGGELRAQLAALEPEVWSSGEFEQLFEISATNPPYADVVRKSDGLHGTVMYVDSPRFYFSFNAGSDGNDAIRTA